MEFHIEQQSPQPIAYIRRVGAYGIGNIQTMEQLKSWAKFNHLMNEDAVILGIAWDNDEETALEHCRYDACILLDKRDFPEDSAVQYDILSGGRYGVFTVPHTAEAMMQAWVELFPDLAQMGYTLDPNRPILERYAARKVAAHLCEICVPIA